MGSHPVPSRPKVHLLKGGSFEIADPPAVAQAPSAVIRYIGNEGFLIEAGSKTLFVDGLIRNPWEYANTPERALASRVKTMDVKMGERKSLPWEEDKIDIAFFDPFFFQNEEAKRIVLERIKPSAVILMHMMNDEVDNTYGRLSPDFPQIAAFRAAMESKVFVKVVR